MQFLHNERKPRKDHIVLSISINKLSSLPLSPTQIKNPQFFISKNPNLLVSDHTMSHYKLIASLILSLCLIAPLAGATQTEVKYCDKKGNYAVKVSGVEISPYPVARGQPATFSISATTGQAISGGKLEIDVAYFGWHIHSESHDLCEETSCPVANGDFLVSHSQVLPGFTPPGSYSLTMKMYDSNNNQLTCIAFDFSIGFASPVADS